jgi:mTERF domain-containing protein
MKCSGNKKFEYRNKMPRKTILMFFLITCVAIKNSEAFASIPSNQSPRADSGTRTYVDVDTKVPSRKSHLLHSYSFYDEADELLSFVEMYEDEHQSFHPLDYGSGIHDDEHTLKKEGDRNAFDRSQGNSMTDLNRSKSNVNGTTNLSAVKSKKEVDQSIDNLVVPDLSTLMASIQLAPASEIAYFYLQNTIGLEPGVMWKITNEVGSVLGFTVQNLENKINLLRRMMNLTDEDVRTIITKQPSILHMSAARNISPTVLYLVRTLDLSKTDLRTMVVAYPCILCYSRKNLARKITFFEKDLGLNVEETRELLVAEPKLFCAGVSSGLEPKLNFLHREMGIPKLDLQKIVKANPRLLMYSLEANLQAKLISFFIMRLYMGPQDILKLLTSYPLIMDYSLENHMLPIAQYFVSELEFSPMELKKILLKFPRLMTHSLFKIKHVVGYLRYQLGMDANEVKRILFQAPQVVSLSTDDTVVSKVTFLRDAFGLENEKDLRKVIAGMPTLLLCNIENNLKPKAEYLLEQFRGDEVELRQAVITMPTLLGYSLEKRIKPRMARILDIGVEPIKITVGITMTDVNFDQWLENKRIRIANGGQLLKRAKKSINNTRKEISKLEDDEIPAESDGRIMHWKR